MKRIALLLAIGTIMLVGCATTGPKITLADYPQLGILSCVAESTVKWQDEADKAPTLFDTIANAKSNNNEKLNGRLSLMIGRADDLIEPAAAILSKSLASLNKNSLLSTETVTGSAAYASAPESKALAIVMLKPAAYHFINDAKAPLGAALKNELKMDAGIYAEFKFQMKMWNGVGHNGTMVGITYLKVYVINSLGKRVFNREYAKVSKEHAPIAMGVFDPETLKALFLSATQDACDAFAADLNA